MKFCWFYQNDLLQLFQPFGVITKLVMLRAKNQVFFSLILHYGKDSYLLIDISQIFCFDFFYHVCFLYRLFSKCKMFLQPSMLCNFTRMCSQPSGENIYVYFEYLSGTIFEDDYDIYYFKYGLWMFWAVNCNLWNYMSDFNAITFQGKECLCPIFITSGTNNNGTECSRTRWWGWYLFLMYWGQISFTWLLFRKKDWTGQSFFSFLWQWSFYHSGFYRICCLMVSPCMLRTIH